MNYLIFLLAGLAALLGVLLLVADHLRKREPEVAEPDSWPGVQVQPPEEDGPSAPEPEVEKPTTGGFSIPMTQRRERRSWAETHGWDFARTDPYLDDEWVRGAAASGAAPRDIVRGDIAGYEMYLASLGHIPVMALRRGEASDVVVDIHRPDNVGESSEDLLPVTQLPGFDVVATEVGPADRMIDGRVRRALTQLPEAVRAVWLESDWAIAELERGSRQEVWDLVGEPLAMIADASRTLPPRGPAGAPPLFPPDHPSRPLPQAPSPEEEYNPAEPDISATPLVIRPEEPCEMPSRTHAESRGVVEPRPLGADEVDAIAEGSQPTPPVDYHGARIVRDLSRGSSIFDDLTEELGTDPLADREENPEE
ncbi:type III secretion system chaperone family protein [Corynebacterium poyangense]|nr:hypothetical protein [Corynebacterium poyangense]